MRVTLTGIDDATEIGPLRRLIADYPFVELGVLHSPKREGTPRYPSRATRDRFVLAFGQDHLALHLCGSAARDTMSGSEDYVHSRSFAAGYGRIQINGYEVSADMRIGRTASECPAPPGRFRYVLQARTEDTLQAVANQAQIYQFCDVLFDPSGGRGIEPFSWPRKPLGVRMGYAGGIGPENIDEVMRALGPLEPDWIDMESGVRDEHDQFSELRARVVLAAVRAWCSQ